MNPLTESTEQLSDAWCQLSAKWDLAKEVWNDAASHNFESTFWLEFESTTAVSIEKLQGLIDTLAQAEREIP